MSISDDQVAAALATADAQITATHLAAAAQVAAAQAAADAQVAAAALRADSRGGAGGRGKSPFLELGVVAGHRRRAAELPVAGKPRELADGVGQPRG